VADQDERLAVNLNCDHEGKRLTFRPDASGNPRYQYQCPTCGDGIGSFLARHRAAGIATLGSLPLFDEALQDRFAAARRQEARDRKAQERAEHTEWYHEYLKSDQWREKAKLVHARAGGICEGCRKAKSTQVHHMDYRDVGAEFLWQLVAICEPCHIRYHSEEDK
jgi:5-methylcytosine-specific restriction endonuclease McrA